MDTTGAMCYGNIDLADIYLADINIKYIYIFQTISISNYKKHNSFCKQLQRVINYYTVE